MKKYKISVSVPKNVIMDTCIGVLGVFFTFSVLGSSQKPLRFFASSYENVFFTSGPFLRDGLGGFVFICSSSGVAVDSASSALKGLVNSLAYPVEAVIPFVGSGFRVSFKSDTTFQHGFSLCVRLGSKTALVRVPYEVLSVFVIGGRSVKIVSYKTANLLNFVNCLTGLAPFKDGKGIRKPTIRKNFSLK